jgi:hypothetical protein
MLRQSPRVSDARWRVGIVDSGLSADCALPVVAQRRFEDTGADVIEGAPVPDLFQHGTRVARIIQSALKPCDLYIAQALDERGVSTAATIAAAIRWLLSQSVQLLHLSLGLREDRAPLARAIEAAVRAGALIVASSPSRGAKPYPARYGGVLAATGDARCALAQISDLRATYADFGGCVQCDVDGVADPRGASIGAAHVTRFIVSHLAPGTLEPQVRARLAALASYTGRERR